MGLMGVRSCFTSNCTCVYRPSVASVDPIAILSISTNALFLSYILSRPEGEPWHGRDSETIASSQANHLASSHYSIITNSGRYQSSRHTYRRQ